MARDFVHVHNHTEYSLLDGANRIPEMVARAKDLGQEALAITDHGVMFGVMEFYMECQKKGIKPLIGMEAYVAPNGHKVKTGREENSTYHLVLLARDLEGYRNLCKLHTIAALEGFYYKPRIDHELLKEHSAGLIGTSACLGSEICQFLLKGNYEEAQKRAGFYKELFGDGNFYIELQDHRLPEQAQIKDDLIRISKELKLPLLATNDAHYLCKETSQAHDVLLCIGTGALVQDTKRLKFQTDEFYIKSTEEMYNLFSDTQEALENTLELASRCNVELGKSRAPMPEPVIPEGMNSREYLRLLAQKGCEARVRQMDERTAERLEYELGVIETTGFEDYFLLVREFAQFTREQGIAFGVRGSAAGALVSYCLGITDVDPLEYDLTFERFLNPERVSMPDIDMDFEDARRDEVIRYVTERFGNGQVAQIITFGTLGAKAAIKDSGRVLGYTPQETDQICKTIPAVPNMTLDKALHESVEFRQMVKSDARYTKLFEVAKDIEGTARHAGVHAAGVVISRGALTDYIPLYRGNEGQPVTAFEMGILEKIGLLKMDFLGLSNLTVLAKAVEHIALNQPGTPKLDWRDFPLDDHKTYEMLGRGDTVGVFQLESGGMRRNIVELKPQDVRELAAMVALYRPGPMEHIPRFVDCKFGRKKIEYLVEEMRPILQETYGVIVYQDQVLKLVQALAGFTLGKADVLRRAMGKKDVQAMESMYVEFIDGCAAKQIDKEKADKVWEMLLPFAGYAFNKAHAVCYALIAYQTAFLKANYPVEYMAALLAVYRDKEDRVTAFIEECRRQDIVVLPPDINRSRVDFTIETIRLTPKSEPMQAIRFGMAAIKGVGQGLVEAIIEERSQSPFRHLYEFAERTRSHGLNKTSLEALIKAGALDCINKNRATLLRYVDAALIYADQLIKSRLAGQDSLFEDGGGGSDGNPYPDLPEEDKCARRELLVMEKEVMGIYLSDHPLRGMERALSRASNQTCAIVPELEDATSVKLAGVIAGLRTIVTKSKGEKMASLVLEDFSGQASCIVFPATYAKLQDLIQKDRVVWIQGQIMHRDRPGSGGEKSIEVRVEEVGEIEAAAEGSSPEEDTQIEGTLTIRIRRATRDELENLRELLVQNPGSFRVYLQFGDPATNMPLELRTRINVEDSLIRKITEAIPGCQADLQKAAVVYRPDILTGEDASDAIAS
ncbi:MAG: DNA polymerase III subunit alpha [Armatimonadetes bacterium]|nr:DNA polymerase III subunit alpha [Armatimonadota bacterium]